MSELATYVLLSLPLRQTGRQAYLVDSIVSTFSNRLVSSSIGRCNELVQFAVSVVSGQPYSLAISWVFASSVVLLLSGVDDRNAVCHDGECGSVLSEGNVVGDAGFAKERYQLLNGSILRCSN